MDTSWGALTFYYVFYVFYVVILHLTCDIPFFQYIYIYVHKFLIFEIDADLWTFFTFTLFSHIISHIRVFYYTNSSASSRSKIHATISFIRHVDPLWFEAYGNNSLFLISDKWLPVVDLLFSWRKVNAKINGVFVSFLLLLCNHDD